MRFPTVTLRIDMGNSRQDHLNLPAHRVRFRVPVLASGTTVVFQSFQISHHVIERVGLTSARYFVAVGFESRVAGQTLFTRYQKVPAQAVLQVTVDPFSTTQLCDR